jgi:hypothetical protein
VLARPHRQRQGVTHEVFIVDHVVEA